LEPFLESRRERAAPYQLFFQSRGEPISLGKPGRKITLVFVIPATDNFTVVVLIKLCTLVVIISMLSVTFSVSMTLGQREIADEHEDSQRPSELTFRRFHFPAPI
jgi:hypothetical protein